MRKLNFDSKWRFSLGDINRWSESDASRWGILDLPHDWSIEGDYDPSAPAGASVGFLPTGKGTYIKEFCGEAGWEGKRIFIEFEGVYMNSEVWINGNFLGRHPYGYTSFIYDLTDHINIDGPNTLKVFVDNSYQPNSRWYSGSGIYRHVWIIVAESVHIGHWGVSITNPEVLDEYARVHVKTKIINQGPQQEKTGQLVLRTVLISPEGDEVGRAETPVDDTGDELTVDQDLLVLKPKLWSPDSPWLYKAYLELADNDRILDTETATFGIRTLKFSADKGFLLNGIPIKLKGGCVHHDNGILGAASHDRAEERKVEKLKASGFNAIRCAHNPPSPAFLAACDRLGMMVIDEAFDCWREGKNPGDYHTVFDDWWERDLSSMVLRDRNHPCVIMWSIGNELMERDGRSNANQTARSLADFVRKLDPTRPVTAALQGIDGDWSKTDAVFSALDVCGYNYNRTQYGPDHERVPNRIIIGSESFPREALENWLAVCSMPHVAGDFVWTSYDYLGEAGIGRVHFDGPKASFLGGYPWNQAHCGDLDLCGIKRPQSYYRDMIWRDEKSVYIAVHRPLPEGQVSYMTPWAWPDVISSWTWPGYNGQTLKVDIYSNCDEVELILNGESFGIKKTGVEERRIASFEIPYEPGNLSVIGYSGGLPAARYDLATAGDPESIRLTLDGETLKAARGEIAFADIEIVDSKGNIVPQADNTIFFAVEGPGELAAVGSADPRSEESYRGNCRKAYQGRCQAVVKAYGTPGDIIFRASAEGLGNSEVVVRVRD